MDSRILVCIVAVLAGCAGPPPDPLADLDPAQPLYDGGGVHLLGPPAEGTPDAQVLSADCVRREAFAYTFNATKNGSAPDTVRLTTPLDAPNTTVFFIAAFVEGPEGLQMAAVWRGGSATTPMQAYRGYTGEWLPTFPDSVTVPLQDGIGRIVIGCEGDAAINYVIGAEDALRPQYLEPRMADHFDLFAAAGRFPGIYLSIPPSTVPSTSMVWTVLGAVDARHEETVNAGVRVGTSEVRWSARPGWSHVTCGHEGFEEHGFMRYRGDLHGVAGESETPMAWSLATLGLSQMILFGALEVVHSGEGEQPGEFLFSVEHLGSADLFYTTYCHGMHIGEPLETLLGAPAAALWNPPEGFV